MRKVKNMINLVLVVVTLVSLSIPVFTGVKQPVAPDEEENLRIYVPRGA